MNQIFRDTSLSIIHVFVKKEIDVLLTVSLNYISCLDCSSKSLLIALPVVPVFSLT